MGLNVGNVGSSSLAKDQTVATAIIAKKNLSISLTLAQSSLQIQSITSNCNRLRCIRPGYFFSSSHNTPGAAIKFHCCVNTSAVRVIDELNIKSTNVCTSESCMFGASKPWVLLVSLWFVTSLQRRATQTPFRKTAVFPHSVIYEIDPIFCTPPFCFPGKFNSSNVLTNKTKQKQTKQHACNMVGNDHKLTLNVKMCVFVKRMWMVNKLMEDGVGEILFQLSSLFTITFSKRKQWR